MFGEILGAVTGGLFAAKGQSRANEVNIAMARENREWQERMSNTAYQRSAADLEKAGLNRILALGSPATTPAGNIANVGNVGAAGVEGAAATGASALSFKRLKQELKNMKAGELDTRTSAAKKVLEMIGVNQSVQESKKRMELIDEQKKALGVPATVGEAAKQAATITKKGLKEGIRVPGVTDRASIIINDTIDVITGKAGRDKALLRGKPTGARTRGQLKRKRMKR